MFAQTILSQVSMQAKFIKIIAPILFVLVSVFLGKPFLLYDSTNHFNIEEIRSI